MTGGVLKLSKNDSGPHHPPILTQRIGPQSGREFRLVQDAARGSPLSFILRRVIRGKEVGAFRSW